MKDGNGTYWHKDRYEFVAGVVDRRLAHLAIGGLIGLGMLLGSLLTLFVVSMYVCGR